MVCYLVELNGKDREEYGLRAKQSKLAPEFKPYLRPSLPRCTWHGFLGIRYDSGKHSPHVEISSFCGCFNLFVCVFTFWNHTSA